MAYELLIFDFDGTLVDTAPDIATHANTTLVKYRFPRKSLSEVKRAIGQGVHELLKDLGFRGEEDTLDEAVEFFKKEYFRRPVIRTAPYPHVRRHLGGVLKGLSKAIVTNKPQKLTEQILSELGLRHFFDAVIGEGGRFPRKPDPASVEFVMKKLKSVPGRTAFVGDSRVDHQTAKGAGIDFIHVSYGYDFSFRPRSKRSLESAREWSEILTVKKGQR